MFLFCKKEESDRARIKRIRSLHGLPVKYVTERRADNDDVIGRGGHLTVLEEELLVDSSAEVIFRAKIQGLNTAFLMSGDGVVLTGVNLLDGVEHTITVHFVYYRK